MSQPGEMTEAKIKGYLLNDAHPQGRSKARFFRAFGFTPERWEEMAAALCLQAAQGAITDTVTLPDSKQYAVEGELAAPDRRAPHVRTVWETRPDAPRPRLITAYPTR